MKILIIGTGLMGGSFGLKLKSHGHEIGGYDQSDAVLDKARKIGLVGPVFSEWTAGLVWADAVLLTIPVSAIRDLLPKLLDQIKPHQFVVDFGSTKESICKVVSTHGNRSRYLAAHPIAGTEYSGPEAAFEALYHQKTMIICEGEKTDLSVRHTFNEWCAYSEMSLFEMTPESHDLHLAYISHLSHVIAYSLSNAVLEKEKDGELILELAGSGFASTVRLAKSSPEMWVPIFLENKGALTAAIDGLLEKLEGMKTAIQSERKDELFGLLEDGRKIRKILK